MGAPVVDGCRVVGRVVGLWRYPVKSMAPESLQQVDVSWHGVAGDRRWAFLDEGRAGSGSPWLTIRERPDLVRYRPSFRAPDRPDRSPVVVTTPNGDVLEITDPALAAELGSGLRAVKQDRGTRGCGSTPATGAASSSTSIRSRPNAIQPSCAPSSGHAGPAWASTHRRSSPAQSPSVTRS